MSIFIRDTGVDEWVWVFMGWVGHFIQPNPNPPIPFLKVDFDALPMGNPSNTEDVVTI